MWLDTGTRYSLAVNKTRPQSSQNCVAFFSIRLETRSFKRKPPAKAAPWFQPYRVYFSWVEMLVNLPLRVVPIVLTVAMITTEMPAAMRPYSMPSHPTHPSKTQTPLTSDALHLVVALCVMTIIFTH